MLTEEKILGFLKDNPGTSASRLAWKFNKNNYLLVVKMLKRLKRKKLVYYESFGSRDKYWYVVG